ncbi:pyridoxine/pyridoxamine 5'-phosphate oxidase [Devosia subaequoris]|uniref:Pyridoxine/pyridoxamine 5'-phosphate oxidase n=1 Tax=Devosia subaequoris TaxID=395930 RepID=A0A7W6ND98_9HYPH|nr:pyridoxine/pyridoxamine 5'-phosphate oxidase [Devosia subaequoris]
MGTRNFKKPVFLSLKQSGVASYRVDNAADALDYLKRFWSSPRTIEYRRAYAICLSALDNLGSAESARAYLIAAAERAGVLYRLHDRLGPRRSRTDARA